MNLRDTDTASRTKEISSVPAKHGCGGGCPPRRNRGVHPQCPCTRKFFGSVATATSAAPRPRAPSIHRADQQGQSVFVCDTDPHRGGNTSRPSIIADGVEYCMVFLGCARGPRPKFRLAKLLWPTCPAGRNNCAHAKVVPSEISLVREAVLTNHERGDGLLVGRSRQKGVKYSGLGWLALSLASDM